MGMHPTPGSRHHKCPLQGKHYLSPLLALCALFLHLFLLAQLRLGQFGNFDFWRISAFLMFVSRGKDWSIAIGHLSAGEAFRYGEPKVS